MPTERWPHPEASPGEIARDRRDAAQRIEHRAMIAEWTARRLERITDEYRVVEDAERALYVVTDDGRRAAQVSPYPDRRGVVEATDELALTVAERLATTEERAGMVEPWTRMRAVECGECRDTDGVERCYGCGGAGWRWSAER